MGGQPREIKSAEAVGVQCIQTETCEHFCGMGSGQSSILRFTTEWCADRIIALVSTASLETRLHAVNCTDELQS